MGLVEPRLHGQQIEVVMLTGDAKAVADAVAADLGIDTVFAEVLPGDKVDKIKELKVRGKRVAMTSRCVGARHSHVRVAKALRERASIHWHGTSVPDYMDGVPSLSCDGIHPEQTFAYRFLVRQNGTYW